MVDALIIDILKRAREDEERNVSHYATQVARHEKEIALIEEEKAQAFSRSEAAKLSIEHEEQAAIAAQEAAYEAEKASA